MSLLGVQCGEQIVSICRRSSSSRWASDTDLLIPYKILPVWRIPNPLNGQGVSHQNQRRPHINHPAHLTAHIVPLVLRFITLDYENIFGTANEKCRSVPETWPPRDTLQLPRDQLHKPTPNASRTTDSSRTPDSPASTSSFACLTMCLLRSFFWPHLYQHPGKLQTNERVDARVTHGVLVEGGWQDTPVLAPILITHVSLGLIVTYLSCGNTGEVRYTAVANLHYSKSQTNDLSSPCIRSCESKSFFSLLA